MSLKMRETEKEIPVSLKACPFCGNKDMKITDEKFFNELVTDHGSAMMSISCDKCNIEKKLYYVPMQNYWIGVGIITESWNRRDSNGTEKD